MAYSTQRAVSDGTLTNLNVSIGYLKQADIQVFYDDLPADDATWSWVGTTSVINFSPAIADGVEVLLKRTTKIDNVLNLFTSGASFTNAALDNNAKQMLYLNQEAVEGAALTDVFSDIDFHGYRIRNLGEAALSTDAVTLGQYQADVGQYVTDATTQAGIATAQAVIAADEADDAAASAAAAAVSAAAAAATVAPALAAAATKATPIDADSVPLVDSADSNALKRVTWVNVKATLKTYFDTLYAAAASVVLPATVAPLADGTAAVGVATKYAREDHVHPLVAAGVIVQDKSAAPYTSYSSTTASIPDDNTKPQISEGTALMQTDPFTPTSSTNLLRVTFTGYFATGASAQKAIVAMFRDSGVNAVRAARHEAPGADASMQQHTLIYEVVAGSTAPTVFSIRYGTNGTAYVNGTTAGQKLDGTMACTLNVQEIKV